MAGLCEWPIGQNAQRELSLSGRRSAGRQEHCGIQVSAALVPNRWWPFVRGLCDPRDANAARATEGASRYHLIALTLIPLGVTVIGRVRSACGTTRLTAPSRRENTG